LSEIPEIMRLINLSALPGKRYNRPLAKGYEKGEK
jgi:hypothetical protein